MVDELLDLTRSDAGIPGEAAGFGQVTASVDDKVGTPGVKVTASGDDTAKNFAFAFTGLKGVQGERGERGERGENTAVISNITLEYTPGTGTPHVDVEAGGTPTDRTLKFIMSNLEGADGHTPAITIGNVTTLDPGSKVTDIGHVADNGDVTFDFGIPRGADGSNATVTAGHGITVTDGQVSVTADPAGPVTVTEQGVNVAVDDTTVKIVGNKLTSLGGAHLIDATFAVADFGDNLTATKAIQGLQAVNLVSPATTSVDNVETYINANPVIQDHTDNPDVPDGSLRMICTNEPEGPITIRIATMKEN